MHIAVIIFSGLLHGLLPSFLPFAAVFCIIPFIALIYEEKAKFWKMYLWGFFSFFGTIWWMTLVDVKGLHKLIAVGTLLLSAAFALKYLFIGALSSFVVTKNRKIAFLFIPAIWLVSEYSLTLGEFSFPWMLDGYSLSPYLYLSQIASVAGIWGLSFLAVISAVIIYERIFEKREKRFLLALIVVAVLISFWGYLRVKPNDFFEEKALVMQPNADQKNWQGYRSLVQSMEVLDSLFEESVDLNKGVYIIPESGIFAYFRFQPFCQSWIKDWLERFGSPIIFGTLTPILDDDFDIVSAYNSAFFADHREDGSYESYGKYHKQVLVPFVETIPFKKLFPMVNRLNLAGGSFTAGEYSSVWKIENLNVAPLICYESIYPDYVRKRVNYGANVLINLTNDGWFGRTTAPFQHAEMSRVRAIENGIAFVRCTNSGISFSVDPYGRYLSRTGLYTREIVEMPIAKPINSTIYRKFGDWLVYLCATFVVLLLIFPIVRKK